MAEGDMTTNQTARLAWTQLKKQLQNCIFLMKSRRIIITKSIMKELLLGNLLYKCLSEVPEKKLVKELLLRFKQEMKRVTKRRESGLENSGAPVEEEDFKNTVERFFDAFNRVDKPLKVETVRELANKQAKACEQHCGSFATNRDRALEMIDDLTKDERGKLVNVNMQGRYWNWKNLLTMTLPEITSSLSNDVKNIIIETSQAEVPATPDRVIGGTALGTTAGFSVFEPYRLSGPETPRFSFDVAEPPSTGGKKSKSAIEIVEKEEKRRERERREVQKKAKREALEEQKKAMKDRERRRRKEEAQKSKEAEKQRKEKAKRYQQHQQEKAEASAVAAKTKTKVKSPKSKQRSPSAADLKKKGDEMWEKAMGMINQKGSTSSATQQAVEAAKKTCTGEEEA